MEENNKKNVEIEFNVNNVDLRATINTIELIAEERYDQIIKHKRSISLDVEQNNSRELVRGVFALLENPEDRTYNYPNNWDKEIVQKMDNKSYKARLIISAALLAAEIDRIEAVESAFKNPVLTKDNVGEWKNEFNTKMKLWYDISNYIPDMVSDDWQTSLHEGSTVDEVISEEKNGW